MNTPAHLIIGLAAFGRSPDPRVTAAAFLGALLPDLSLYLMAGWSLFVAQIAPQVVFGQMYFSDEWQSIFAVDNSIPLWAMVLGVAVWRRWPLATAFAAAGLLHLFLDFPLHHDDARRHFWPLTNWVFHSPLSYWDPQFYGRYVGAAEILICAVLSGMLLRYFKTFWARSLIVVLALAEIAPPLLFGLLLGPMHS